MWDLNQITFRPLEEADFPLMHRWLAAPHVKEWWKEDYPSVDDVARKYGPMLTDEEPTDGYILLYAGTPIGFFQAYRIEDHPEYAACVQAEEPSAGIDLFIGELEYAHRGLGPIAVRRFLQDVVFTDPGIESCVLGPNPNNARAIRAYERVGFRYVRTILVPSEPDPEYLMRITRAQAMAAEED